MSTISDRLLEIRISDYSSSPTNCTICLGTLSTEPEEEKSDEISSHNNSYLLIHRVTNPSGSTSDHIHHRTCLEKAWENRPDCPLCKSPIFIENPLHPGRVVISGSRYRRLDILEIYGPAISQADRAQALRVAIQVNSLESIQILLANGAPISSQDRGMAVRMAAQEADHENNFSPILKLLLQNGPVSLTNWRIARNFLLAKEMDPEVLEQHRPHLNVQDLGHLLRQAMRNNDEELIYDIRQNRIIFASSADRGLTVRVALATGYPIAELLNGPISEQDLGLAVLEATKKGDKKNLDLLLKHGPISAQDREEALLQAVFSARNSSPQPIDLEMVQLLLGKISIPPIVQKTLLVHATRLSNIAILKFLLEKGSISEQERVYTIQIAITENEPDIIELLLPDEATLSEENRLLVIQFAIEEEQFAILPLLLNGPLPEGELGLLLLEIFEPHLTTTEARSRFGIDPSFTNEDALHHLAILLKAISPDNVGEAVLLASRNSLTRPLVTALLTQGEISEEDRNNAVVLFAEQTCLTTRKLRGNYEQALAALLRSGPISQETRERAAIQVAQEGLREPLLLLLESGSISIQSWKKAVRNASYLSNEQLLLILLKYGENRGFTLSEKTRGTAVKAVAARGNQRMLQTLLRTGEVSTECLNSAVVKATLESNIDILGILLEKGAISIEARGLAARQAVLQRDREALQMLLRTGAISMTDRGLAVREAAMQGNVAMLRILLDNGALISIADRGLAVRLGVLHADVIPMLLEHGALISKADRGSSVQAAASAGNLVVVLALLASGPISPEDLKLAREKSVAAAHLLIVKALQKK